MGNVEVVVGKLKYIYPNSSGTGMVAEGGGSLLITIILNLIIALYIYKR